MERSRKAVGKVNLNFTGFGSATESEKDDFKKITDAGHFIEQKIKYNWCLYF